MNIVYLPFDEQNCNLIFASRDDPVDYVELTLTRWNLQNNLPPDLKRTTFQETNLGSGIKIKRFDSKILKMISRFRIFSRIF